MSIENDHPRIDEFYAAEEEILRAKVQGMRAAITHAGEKGRSIEVDTMALLRNFLPSEYGLSTGFVAFHDEACVTDATYDQAKDKIRLSSQVDIIIYDAIKCGPIIRLGACEVFPLESVYAYVEVKTSISSKEDLVELMGQSERLRSMRVRLYWSTVAGDLTASHLLVTPIERIIPIRTYIFILEANSLGDAESIRQKIESVAKHGAWEHATITGMYIGGRGFYYLQPVNSKLDPRSGDAVLISDGALLAFKHSLYSGLSRYPRIERNWTAAIDLYSRKFDA